MNTLQINVLLSNVSCFVGTFPANHIRVTGKRPAAYIINTSPYDESAPPFKQGSHWIAIYIKRGGKGYYFDSFGLPPLQADIQQFLARTCPKGYKCNTQTLQHYSSRVCGVYCIDFLFLLSRGISLRTYLTAFTANTVLNDRSVVKRTQCRLSTLLRRLHLDLWTLTK